MKGMTLFNRDRQAKKDEMWKLGQLNGKQYRKFSILHRKSPLRAKQYLQNIGRVVCG